MYVCNKREKLKEEGKTSMKEFRLLNTYRAKGDFPETFPTMETASSKLAARE